MNTQGAKKDVENNSRSTTPIGKKNILRHASSSQLSLNGMINNPQARLNSRGSTRSPINEGNNDVRSSFQSISNAIKKDDT
jgi:hypothetical protein